MKTHERKRLMSSAYRYAFSRLALNYYTFCEMMLESPAMAEEIRARENEFGQLLDGFLSGEDRTDETDALRSRTVKEMELLTSYADCYMVYEYVLNRLERRFVELDAPKETPEEFADRIVERLRASEDSVILDSGMRSVVAQLPIRYTREKFYGLVTDRLTVYIGADKAGIEGLLYMLRTSAMVDLPEGRAEQYPDLEAAYTALRDADYRNMDRDGYENCRFRLDRAIEAYQDKADVKILFESLLNDLYILFLSRNEAMIDVWENNMFRHVITGVREHFQREGLTDIDETLTESLKDLEGIQESAMERIHFKEGETDRDLKKMEILMSASEFAPLEEKNGDTEPADREWVEEKSRQFCEDLEASFKGMPKPVMRAVMAGVLAQLPMTFRSVDELRDYVSGSLLACTDYAEREACMELLTRELLDE